MHLLGSFVGNGLYNSSGTDAAGASVDTLYLAACKLCADFLKVGHETSFCLVVSMGDVVANLGSFTAYIANLGHDETSLWYWLIGFLQEKIDLK